MITRIITNSQRSRRLTVLLANVTIVTGRRVSELVNLTAADVHLDSGAYLSCQGNGRRERITRWATTPAHF